MTLMRLNDEEQDILAGKSGPVARQALEHQLKVGEFFGAENFVPVTQAHIMADTESLGEAGVRWLEGLAAAGEARRRVRIPTITDPRGTDFAKASFLKQTSAMLDLERRAISALKKLGVMMTDTCINYQTIQAPARNEHVAFGDTGVVIYSNSVCAARSNFEGGPSALAAGLTGRTALWFSSAQTAACDIAGSGGVRAYNAQRVGRLGWRDRAYRGQLLGGSGGRGDRTSAAIGRAEAFRRRDGEFRFDCPVSPGGSHARSGKIA
jgi:hypothetical protein